MNIVVTCRHGDISQDMRKYAEEKVSRVLRDVPSAVDAQVIMDVQKSQQLVEVIIHARHVTFNSKQKDADMHSAIDKVVDKLLAQARKHREKINKHRPRNNNHDADSAKSVETEKDETESKPRIISSQRYAVKPMYIDEAVLQMGFGEKDFMMFYNADTEEINVIYRRKDGNYGLIEPEIK